MNSQALPPDGGGGKSGSGSGSSGQGGIPAGGKPPGPGDGGKTAPPVQPHPTPHGPVQHVITQQKKTKAEKKMAKAEKKSQEKAKVIVQPVHPPLSTTLPLINRQSDSPQPPAIFETTLPTIIKTSIPTLKHQTVPALSGVMVAKPATPPSAVAATFSSTTSTLPPPSSAATAQQSIVSSAISGALVPPVIPPVAIQTRPAAYMLSQQQSNTTVPSSVIPARASVAVAAPITGAPAAVVVTGAPVQAIGSISALPAGAIATQYAVPSVQKLPPNSAGDAPHTKGGVIPVAHLPPSTTAVAPSMITGHMPYIGGTPVGLQLPQGAHQYSAQFPRGLTTALLTRAGVPQAGAVSTPAFTQQPIYGYPRPHTPGQVHLLTQRAGSPGMLAAAGAIPRAPSPASTLPASQPHTLQDSVRLIQHIPTSQGSKPDSAAQAKVELKMVIKKDTSKADAVAKGDGKSDARPSSRGEFPDKAGESKKDGNKAEERVSGVKLAVALSGKAQAEKAAQEDGARVAGATEASKVEMRSDGRVEMRVDVRPIHRQQDMMVPPRWSVPGQRPGPTYIVNKDWQGIPPTSATHAGGLPGHMMTQIVTAPGGVLPPSSTTPGTSHVAGSHAIVRSIAPPSTAGLQPSVTSSGAIPVAKVYPRQQPQPQVVSAPRFPVASAMTPHEQSAAYLQVHRNSPGLTAPTTGAGPPATLATTVPVLHTTAAGAPTEVKMERPPGPPGFALSYYYHPDHLGYQQALAMQQFQGRHNFTPISTNAIRPPLDGAHRLPLPPNTSLAQASPVAAAVAAAAHAANMGGAPGRPGQLTMMVGADPRRPIGLPGTAEGSLSSFNMAQVPQAAMALGPGQGTPITNPGASPRPSILRKRNNDGSSSRKPVMVTAVSSQPSSPGVKVERLHGLTSSPKPSDSLPSSQHSENSNASEASTDTAPPSVGSGSIRIKQESDANGLDLASSLGVAVLAHENSVAPSINTVEEVGPSPRKKPRKQQHVVATEHPMMLDDGSTDEEKETKPKVPFKLHKKEKKEKKNAAKAAAAAAKAAAAEAEALKVVQFFKRPCPRLVDSYRQSWKPAHNHFERYSDVKLKEEKKVGIHEIANQRGILKKTDGWKIHHIAYQFDDLNTMEKDVYEQMKSFKDGVVGMNGGKLKESETDKISELVQGSLQRSQYVMENLEEAKGTILKMLDHKTKVAGIVKKHANKRHVKKKHSP